MSDAPAAPESATPEPPTDTPEPTLRLPDRPDLAHLRRQAKRLLRELRTEPAAEPPTLARAQWLLARRYGFASWPRLLAHVDTIQTFTRVPERSQAPRDSDADRFLRAACLSYTDDGEAALGEATRMLRADPTLAGADVFTQAATGDAESLAATLAADPAAAIREGGPYGWAPILYLTYSRLPDASGRSATAALRVLLDAGAAPDTGFLWAGLTSPFTALTGAFGGGESDQPPHPQSIALARMLLDAGADPNDNQTLYNRMFRPNDDHLELLFAYGLGVERDSVWRRRLGRAYPSATAMVGEQLRWAAGHGMLGRARLLLTHGVDPDTTGYHPIHGQQTPYRLAVLGGHPDIAALLAAAGAATDVVDPSDALVGAAQAGDPDRVAALLADDRTLLEPALRQHPDAVATAAEGGQVTAIRILLDLGFDPSRARRGDVTPLHLAALGGHDAVAEVLLTAGADPTARDAQFGGRPAEWAAHNGHQTLAERLSGAAEDREVGA